jgi:hypothetical protein
MSKPQKLKPTSETALPTSTSEPLIFISHDGRDAALAEALGNLLERVSAGMIKTFRSSDKQGTDGIPFGEEWYGWLMAKLAVTSDVVCLFTERSIDKPWILFEAGVAKGKLNTTVTGLAIGVPLSKVSGPFSNFHNMESSEGELTKLVKQLAQRAPQVKLFDDLLKQQIQSFKNAEAEILKGFDVVPSKEETKEEGVENTIARLVEEMKALPSRVAERVADGEYPKRKRRRRFHPMMLEELMHFAGAEDTPFGILMAASLIKDDAPWIYEMAMEVYRAVKAGDRASIEQELERLHRMSHFAMRGPWMEEFGVMDKDSHFAMMEFPRILENALEKRLHDLKSRSKSSKDKT